MAGLLGGNPGIAVRQRATYCFRPSSQLQHPPVGEGGVAGRAETGFVLVQPALPVGEHGIDEVGQLGLRDPGGLRPLRVEADLVAEGRGPTGDDGREAVTADDELTRCDERPGGSQLRGLGARQTQRRVRCSRPRGLVEGLAEAAAVGAAEPLLATVVRLVGAQLPQEKGHAVGQGRSGLGHGRPIPLHRAQFAGGPSSSGRCARRRPHAGRVACPGERGRVVFRGGGICDLRSGGRLGAGHSGPGRGRGGLSLSGPVAGHGPRARDRTGAVWVRSDNPRVGGEHRRRCLSGLTSNTVDA